MWLHSFGVPDFTVKMLLFYPNVEVFSKKTTAFLGSDYCVWSISNKFANIHMHSLPPHKSRPICLQKTLFELQHCSNVMIISARCLHGSDRCSLFSVILMGPKVIVPSSLGDLASKFASALNIIVLSLPQKIYRFQIQVRLVRLPVEFSKGNSLRQAWAVMHESAS